MNELICIILLGLILLMIIYYTFDYKENIERFENTKSNECEKKPVCGCDEQYKDRFNKYDKMYDWYEKKINADKQAAGPAIEEAQAKYQKDYNRMLAESQKPGGNVNPNAGKDSVNSITQSMAKGAAATGDQDNINEVNNATSSINVPNLPTMKR